MLGKAYSPLTDFCLLFHHLFIFNEFHISLLLAWKSWQATTWGTYKNNDTVRQQFVVYDTGPLNFAQNSKILILNKIK